ncbi:MAG: DUF1566 domain-containing protein [Dehalococcoidia bacterium]|nr:DUF1566 domain-containing protein [Dehalococcoidia bacterium]
MILASVLAFGCDSGSSSRVTDSGYPVVDTGQTACYDEGTEISCPSPGAAFYGQDAQYAGNEPSYTDNGDGTTTDNVTGLIWQRSPDTNGDGTIDATDKLTIDEAETYCSGLTLAGQHDWRLPTIKEMYSLIQFSGTDPSGYEESDTSNLVPFIDTDHFDFAYGDTGANERIIDSQYASSTFYAPDPVSSEEQLLFGVNFADGRIKGYGMTLHGADKTFFVIAVRGTPGYGENDFENNGNGTITDHATNLMWSQDDSGAGLNWREALDFVQQKNEESYHGHADWRLPNAKELQSIVDYTRSPDTANFGAADPMFTTSVITNEAGQIDYPWYWSSTTHANFTQLPGSSAVYVAFGRALGYMDGEWTDVHGAGCQRSDPKIGDPSDFPEGRGPQGDAIRIYNYVRMVRDATD